MVQILTDSSADFELHEFKELNVKYIPLTVNFGEEEYKEIDELGKDEFYGMLDKNPNHPKTSQPSTGDFADVFESIKAQGDEVVCVLISSQLSGTYQGACLARDMLNYEECYIVDSRSTTAGLKILVELAVKLRDEGKSAREISECIEDIKSRLNIYASLDTLEFLRRGGRISDAAVKIGSIAHLKPIVQVDSRGTVEVPMKAIGKKRAISTIIKSFEESNPDTDMPIYLVYSHIKENAMELAEALKKAGYEIRENKIVNIGAVIGTHVGPNAYGIAYIKRS
ncbi:MAG: DegV family protein [Clostridia bacterium]|nr:DegV family protein [Clostridia bacterium]